eukprot:3359580-Pleurochrysis_carterae.AAC.4
MGRLLKFGCKCLGPRRKQCNSTLAAVHDQRSAGRDLTHMAACKFSPVAKIQLAHIAFRTMCKKL